MGREGMERVKRERTRGSGFEEHRGCGLPEIGNFNVHTIG